MRRGDPIRIQEIKNGVLIMPDHGRPDSAVYDKVSEIIAFQDKDSFLNWMHSHFQNYDPPTWEG